LSILENGPGTFSGRKLGVLVSDGADAKTVQALRRAAKAAGATVAFVAATRHGGVFDSEGNPLTIDEKIDGAPSVLFDAIAVVGGAAGIDDLAGRPATKQFVTDAHNHAKFIAHNEPASIVFDAAGLGRDQRVEGYFVLDGTKKTAEAYLDSCGKLRCWDRLDRKEPARQTG
jgi:catalase